MQSTDAESTRKIVNKIKKREISKEELGKDTRSSGEIEAATIAGQWLLNIRFRIVYNGKNITPPALQPLTDDEANALERGIFATEAPPETRKKHTKEDFCRLAVYRRGQPRPSTWLLEALETSLLTEISETVASRSSGPIGASAPKYEAKSLGAPKYARLLVQAAISDTAEAVRDLQYLHHYFPLLSNRDLVAAIGEEMADAMLDEKPMVAIVKLIQELQGSLCAKRVYLELCKWNQVSQMSREQWQFFSANLSKLRPYFLEDPKFIEAISIDSLSIEEASLLARDVLLLPPLSGVRLLTAQAPADRIVAIISAVPEQSCFSVYKVLWNYATENPQYWATLQTVENKLLEKPAFFRQFLQDDGVFIKFLQAGGIACLNKYFEQYLSLDDGERQKAYERVVDLCAGGRIYGVETLYNSALSPIRTVMEGCLTFSQALMIKPILSQRPECGITTADSKNTPTGDQPAAGGVVSGAGWSLSGVAARLFSTQKPEQSLEQRKAAGIAPSQSS